MFAAIRTRLLHFLRVPHDPEPPFGAPGSTKVFRAARNFYYIRLGSWAAAQLGATVGIVVSLMFLAGVRREYDAVKDAQEQRAAWAARAAAASKTATPANTPDKPSPSTNAPPETAAATATASTKTTAPKKEARSKKSRETVTRAFVDRTPRWVLPLIELLELAGIAGFLFQLPVTFAAVRLDWEMRWYIVTDRSLRIRAGIWSLQESTMSFANLQQVEVSQGPLQRLLGIADVTVQSAGGGIVEHGKHAGESLHTGTFHGVDNAQEIRDLILERLRLFRQAGLGDPDDHQVTREIASAPAAAVPAAATPLATAASSSSDARAAAQELLAEARALRSTLS